MSAIDLPACLTEDSTDCWWDAGFFGNGEGVSFVTYGSTWQAIDVPAGHRIEDVSVTPAVIDPGDYTAADQPTFEWTFTQVTTSTSVPPAYIPINLPPTGGAAVTTVVITAGVALAAGITALCADIRRRRAIKEGTRS